MQRRVLVTLCALYGLALLPGLAVLPYWTGVRADVASAASLGGYNNQWAYVFLGAWVAVGLVGFALLQRHGALEPLNDPADGRAMRTLSGGDVGWLEILAVASLAFALHWPPFLAKGGPYYESVYFLNAAHRISSGLLPYREFEFSYGPMILWMLREWTAAFGFSMQAYFWLIALLEAAQFAVLTAALQRLIPARRHRLVTLALLGVLLFNVTLGMNYTAIRWLLPMFAIVLVAARPYSAGSICGAAGLLGLGTAYSHDVGLVGLCAVLAMYVVIGLQHDLRRHVGIAAGIALGAAAVWFATVYAILGALLPDYLGAAAHQLSRRAAGECAFPFHWTLNAAGVMSLLAISVAAVGRGLGRAPAVALETGDRLLVCALAYSLLAMKGGLGRCDMGHLSMAVLVLIVAVRLGWPRRAFSLTPSGRRLAEAAVYVTVVTAAIGYGPAVHGYLSTLARGASDSLVVRASAGEAAGRTRAPSVEAERSRPVRAFVELGEYLADPVRRLRPVYCYNEAWWLYIRVGAFSDVYASDFVTLSDEDGRAQSRLLETRPDTIVVMGRQEYRRVYRVTPDPAAIAGGPAEGELRSLARRVLSRVASVHFTAVALEREAVAGRIDRTVGSYLRQHWAPVQAFGDFVVLERVEASAAVARHGAPRVNQ